MRDSLIPGVSVVLVVQKRHQRTGELTEGVVQRILTNSRSHPHGIKVLLSSGVVGRVHALKQRADGVEDAHARA